MIETLNENWFSGAWQNYQRTIYSYMGDQTHVTEMIQEDWNDNAWIPARRTSYVLDAADRPLEALSEDWEGRNWIPIARQVYEYETTGAGESAPKPELSISVYPNPFNPETTFRFQLEAPARVDIDIYDIRGRLVRTLLRETLSAGEHSLVWDGRNGVGETLSSGVYLYRVRAGSGVQSGRLLMMK